MERKKFLYGSAATAAAAGLLGLCCAGIWKYNNPEMSDIVAGVPAQVEAKKVVQGSCVAHVGVVCAKYDFEHQLTLEQCPEDLATAKQGIPVTSYDNRVGSYAAGCAVATIVVPQRLYEDTTLGGMVFPPGVLGEPIAKG